MTTPNVTELPLHMEPTTRDPFLAAESESASGIRELDHRRNDGIDVRLLWNQADGQVTVAVSDAKTGEAFAIDVAPADARDAFLHPYAHAAFTGARPAHA